ncbi:Ig-like domain-containing protein [Pantoea endophytica]|uniref:Ig-like domain-containing protein n=1 Tax=Pantoea endophytica TaxID=92488 RepID=UPI001AE6DB5D|nr:Ig-like domain-containing protein [Pantoea endophytica]
MQHFTTSGINTSPILAINFLRTESEDYFVIPGSVTDETRPAVYGSAAPNSRIDLYDGQHYLGSVVANEAGAWRFQPPSEAPFNGAVSLRAEQSGVSSAAFTFTAGAITTPRAQIKGLYDVDAADQEIQPGNASATLTSDATPMMLITGRPGATVQVLDNGKTLTTLTLDEGGNATWTIAPPLSAGPHDISLSSTDQTVETAPWKINVDAANIINPLSIDDVAFDNVGETGDIRQGTVTDDARPTFSGNAAALQIVTLHDENDRVLGSVQADESGRWSLELPVNLSNGAHRVVAKSDAQVSESFNFTVQVPVGTPVTMNTYAYDNVAAQGSFRSGGTTDDNRPSFSGTAGAGQVVTIYDEFNRALGTTTANRLGNWSLEIRNELAEGNHKLVAKTSSGSSSAFELTVVSPTALPVTLDQYAYDNVGTKGRFYAGATTDDTRPTFTGTAGPGQLVTLYDENNRALGSVVANRVGNWSIEITQALGNGNHTIVAKTGTQTSASFEFVVSTHTVTPVTLDQTAYDNVETSGMFGAGGTTDDQRPTFSGTAGVGELVTLYDENNRPLGSTVADNSGKWSVEIIRELNVGQHSVVAKTATQSSGTFEFTVVAPDFTPVTLSPYAYDNVGTSASIRSGGVTDDDRPSFSGSAAAGQLVTLYDQQNRVLGSTTANRFGNWSLEITTPLNEGPNSVVAMSGSQVSGAFTLTVNTANLTPVTIDNQYYDNVRVPGYVTVGEGTTDDTRPRFTGTGPAGKQVELFDENGRSLGKTVTNTGGIWRLEITKDLHEGVNQVYAKIGNQFSQPIEVEVDTHIPTPLSIDSTALDNVGVVKNIVNGNILPTDDDRPTFTGSAPAGETVTLLDQQGRALGSTVADSAGRWELELSTSLNQGLNQVTAQVGSEISNTFVLFVRSSSVFGAMSEESESTFSIESLLQDAQPALFATAAEESIEEVSLDISANDMRVNSESGVAVQTENGWKPDDREELNTF